MSYVKYNLGPRVALRRKLSVLNLEKYIEIYSPDRWKGIPDNRNSIYKDPEVTRLRVNRSEIGQIALESRSRLRISMLGDISIISRWVFGVWRLA